MIQKDELTAAVLAGGQSKRFGRRKEMAKWKDTDLLSFAMNLALEISDSGLLISGENYDRLPKNIELHSDRIPECGPLGGIYTALYYAHTPWIAILPCDMPRLTVSMYHTLWEYQRDNLPVVAVSEKGLEPLVSIWPKSAMDCVRMNISESKLSLRHTLSQLNMIQVNIPEVMPDYHPDMFLNINYEQDLDKSQEIRQFQFEDM